MEAFYSAHLIEVAFDAVRLICFKCGATTSGERLAKRLAQQSQLKGESHTRM
jgi:hypothetical protein